MDLNIRKRASYPENSSLNSGKVFPTINKELFTEYLTETVPIGSEPFSKATHYDRLSYY